MKTKQRARTVALGGFQDRFDTDRLRAALPARGFGRVLRYSDQVTSTNDVILDMAEDGAPHGAVCLAEEQTDGRGRRGYRWYSPPGCGIWASVLLRPCLSASRTPPLTLCAAAAVARALEATAGVTVEIKWPNDLLIRNRKVAGMLAETRVTASDEPVVVVGMGINVNHTRALFPEDISESATSLRIESGGPFARQDLFLAILASFESAYERFLGSGPGSLIAEVNARLAWRGRLVEAESPAGAAGRLSRVDEEGGLLLEGENRGAVVIRSGSIRLRPDR
ncbi:MAG: biotin--[acetyl-CoA-carboxylase] ligase [Gemmatimonadetes bacterium]|nr:biotin--[acetyl-CoA-carboxylase] ligase [Gemmatimonadota bacterium]